VLSPVRICCFKFGVLNSCYWIRDLNWSKWAKGTFQLTALHLICDYDRCLNFLSASSPCSQYTRRYLADGRHVEAEWCWCTEREDTDTVDTVEVLRTSCFRYQSSGYFKLLYLSKAQRIEFESNGVGRLDRLASSYYKVLSRIQERELSTPIGTIFG
jgi:hypothetical protein